MKPPRLTATIAALFMSIQTSFLWADVEELVDYLQDRPIPLEYPADLDPLMERIGSARLVLLGESSHGTSEYYRWRAEISKRLIQEKGFDFIAVEGDWPSCYQVNKYAKSLPGAPATADEALDAFDRWPRWMWANEETRELVEWLARHNAAAEPNKQAGFYGIDLYSVPRSIEAVLEYKREIDEDLAEDAGGLYQCLVGFGDNLHDYGRYFAHTGRDCSDRAMAVIDLLRDRSEELAGYDLKAYFNAKQNAILVHNAERHYRGMADPRMNSWNERVRHMHLTIRRLLQYHGPESRGIVWAHNTHIGDARATTMAAQQMENIGQLTREEFGPDNVVLVGLGTHRGTVLAGSSWGAPMQTMNVPPAIPGSVEHVFNRLDPGSFLLIFEERDVDSPLGRTMGNRAKGVTYNPRAETGNYVPTIMPRRYDAFIFFDETTALTPIDNP